MSWYRHHWWWVGLEVVIPLAVFTVLDWHHLDVQQRVLLGSFIVLLLHEFEEWGWPGGEPVILNSIIHDSPTPDHYPSNANSAMVVNVFVTYPVYIVAVIFSNAIWLGLFAAFLFWLGQFMFHGVLTTRKLKKVYNPGLLTVIVGGLPLGIIYVIHVQSNHLVSVWDWVGAVACMVFFVVVVMLKLTFTWLADKDSPYRFTEAEMARGHVVPPSTTI
jgi:hypothetical protein